MTQTIWTSTERSYVYVFKPLSPATTPCLRTWMIGDVEMNAVSMVQETEIHVAAHDRPQRGQQLAILIALELS